MPIFPTGVITLVFTDIEGSSALWEKHRADFAPVLAEHNRLLRAAAAQWNGVEVKTEGDAFFLVFSRASDAVRFAVDAQLGLVTANWGQFLPGLSELRVRMGMHSGEPILSQHPDGSADYFGPAVNRAARVGGAGHGGQVLLSDATYSLAKGELPPEIGFEDLGRHQLKGVGEETLWQVGHAGLPGRFPTLKTDAGSKHNLPQQTTPFIGREKEIAEWSALLRDPAVRELTLIGFGGQGKTRLALQIAEELLEDFSDGVWWVEVEDARDAEAMVARIAHELRLHLQPQPTVREQVLNFHRDRQLLLVLDNTEQIPEAGQVVNELLAAGPSIKCLVTTRKSLDIRAERCVQVPPLPSSDAAALFVERASSRVADFAITPENRPAIEELCNRLEGVPLAIELAASRITVLSPAEILDRLDERFRVLQTRAPELPPRQRALRGAIDWSYDLLTPEDKALLAELSVFAGGFTSATAEDVTDNFDALDGIAELRSHSLLRTDQSGGNTRFSMLESVRAYASEKLSEMPIAAELRDRHAAVFVRYAETRAAALRTKGEAAALDEFLVERGNIRAALTWAAAMSDAPLAARLAIAMYEPLYRLGFWDEARTALNCGWETLEAAEGNQPLRDDIQLRLASLAHDIGDFEAAETGAQAALELSREQGDKPGQAAALNLLGLLATDKANEEEAAQFFQDALALRAEKDNHGRAIALHNLARLASRAGDIPAARRQYEEALVLRRAGGDARGEAETLGNLGVLAQNSGDLPAARDLYLQSLGLRRTLRDRMGIALMLYNLGEVAELESEFSRSITLYTHAGRIFREIGSAYAAAPVEALSKLEEKIDEQFRALAPEAEAAAWEECVK